MNETGSGVGRWVNIAQNTPWNVTASVLQHVPKFSFIGSSRLLYRHVLLKEIARTGVRAGGLLYGRVSVAAPTAIFDIEGITYCHWSGFGL